MNTKMSTDVLMKMSHRWRTVLATMARPFAFARFGLSWILELWLDKEIQQKRRQYDDQNGNLDSYNQINESLIDIQNIMRKNIDEVVQRVEKLDRKCSNSHLE